MTAPSPPQPIAPFPPHYETVILDRVIWGRPQPKGRPRTFYRNGKVQTITPRATFEWEIRHAHMIRMSLQRATVERYIPLAFGAIIVWPRPKSRPKYVSLTNWKLGSRWYHPVKPDGDNVIKTVWDTLKRARVFNDDSQIVRCEFSDWIAARGEKPHVRIWLSTLKMKGVS